MWWELHKAVNPHKLWAKNAKLIWGASLKRLQGSFGETVLARETSKVKAKARDGSWQQQHVGRCQKKVWEWGGAAGFCVLMREEEVTPNSLFTGFLEECFGPKFDECETSFNFFPYLQPCPWSTQKEKAWGRLLGTTAGGHAWEGKSRQKVGG